MKAVLVSIDGTLADTQERSALAGSPDFFKREALLRDAATPDSVRCLRELAQKYRIIYISVRPVDALAATEEWLHARGFPDGALHLAPTHAELLVIAKHLKSEFDFIAGIGTTWQDNEAHLEIGCQSVLLKENEGHWDTVRNYLLGQEHAAVTTAEALLAPWAKDIATKEPHQLDVLIAAADIPQAVGALQQARWGYLTAISGLDHPSEADGTIEVLYHFCNGAAVVTLRAHTPRQEARVPSICGVIPSAGFFEQELSEMLGVVVAGMSDSRRLFLPDDWPDGVYPLRKDFVPDERAAKTEV